MLSIFVAILLIALAVGGVVMLVRRTSGVKAPAVVTAQPVLPVDTAVDAQVTVLVSRAGTMVVVLPRSMHDLQELLHFVFADILREGAFRNRGADIHAAMDKGLARRVLVLREAMNRRMEGTVRYRVQELRSLSRSTEEGQERATREFVGGLTAADAQLLLATCVADYQTLADVHQAYLNGGLRGVPGTPPLPQSTAIQDLCRQASWNEISLAIAHDMKLPPRAWPKLAWFMMSLFGRTHERILLPPLRQELNQLQNNLGRQFSRVMNDAEADAGSSQAALVEALAFLPGFRALIWSHADLLMQLLRLAIRQHSGIDEGVRYAEDLMEILQQIVMHQQQTLRSYRPQGDL